VDRYRAGGGGVSGLLSLTDVGFVVLRFATAVFTFRFVVLAACLVFTTAVCSAFFALWVIVGLSDDVVVSPEFVMSAADADKQEKARPPANSAAMTGFT